MGGLQTKSMTSQRAEPSQDGGYALPWQRYDNNKMAAICYYGNVMATTRRRVCVTMEMLSQHVGDVSSVMHAGCLHADRTIQKEI